MLFSTCWFGGFLRVAVMLIRRRSLALSLGIIDKDLNIVARCIDTVPLENQQCFLIPGMDTDSFSPWGWQSVYFASISSVLVGPTTWYSSVPTMHQL